MTYLEVGEDACMALRCLDLRKRTLLGTSQPHLRKYYLCRQVFIPETPWIPSQVEIGHDELINPTTATRDEFLIMMKAAALC